MQNLNLAVISLRMLLIFVALLPFASCLSHEVALDHKSSPKLKSDVALHGILLWLSMGFLAPLGILIIRMSHREEGGKKKVFFYLHLVLQVLSVLLATAGAIMSIKSFENAFDNNHQRIGLALYGAIWVQAIIGFLRPLKGSKRRGTWYFLHWLLGTIISLIGIINIYTGLNAYHNKLSAKTRIWTILFTAQISFMSFFYLFQDKWVYLQKQGVILGDIDEPNPMLPANQVNPQSDAQKVLVLEACSKRNALKNLFD
ncbi:cytochrome b561 domain-containing protein At4g18260 [Mercurialis annua]|uniref:cytochrome b561 domain-containing protein At4g18260 n=1 Tax=Mercurialis annua TaxID=3986 RepID=UPI00215FEAA1|nr:cytochrome b561 domain-containing protein At4g18260 [Mercurialis annua]